MLGHFLLIVGIALLFYAVIPAVGAFMARGRWRRFRQTVTEASHYPTASPAAIGRERSALIGYYRFFGTLEAIQGDNRIWLTNGRFSVAADLRDVRVYLIPETENSAEVSHGGRGPAGAALGSVPWNRIFSLPEGTPVFVGGALFSEEGRGVFRDNARARLLVVIHDCPQESVVLRAISAGRQRNEYINPLTLPSVCIGSLSLILLAFTVLAIPERIVSLLALTAGIAPLSPFLPPGFPLYFLYRFFWKKARLLRVQRDLVRLPLRYFPPRAQPEAATRATLLPDMEPYVMVRGRLDPADPAVIICDGAPVRLPPDIRRIYVELPRGQRARLRGAFEEVVAFCGYSVEEDGLRLRKPDDPMAGNVLLPGDPPALSRASKIAARTYEMISVACVALEVAVNVPLVFLLLSLLIR